MGTATTAVVTSLTLLNYPPPSPMGASAFVFVLVVGAEGVRFMFVVGVRVRGRRRGRSRCLVRVCRWRLCLSVRRCPFTFIVHMLGRSG
jgi:hypothetical protein